MEAATRGLIGLARGGVGEGVVSSGRGAGKATVRFTGGTEVPGRIHTCGQWARSL